MPQCQVPDCPTAGKEYKNNAGLVSHMRMVHSVNLKGEPIDPEIIARQRKTLAEAVAKGAKKRYLVNPHATDESVQKARKAASSPEARAKATATLRARHYEKLAAQGIFRCPECMENLHRKVEFSSPAELGKHRRFKHGVVGVKHQARKEQEAKKAARGLEQTTPVHAEKVAAVATQALEATRPPAARVKCPHCHKTFKNPHGLTVHIATMHKDSQSSTELALTPTNSKELTNGHGATEGNTTHYANGKSGRSHYDDSKVTEAIAVAHVAGNLEGLILAASHEYDVAPKQFARRVILALSERYS